MAVEAEASAADFALSETNINWDRSAPLLPFLLVSEVPILFLSTSFGEYLDRILEPRSL